MFGEGPQFNRATTPTTEMTVIMSTHKHTYHHSGQIDFYGHNFHYAQHMHSAYIY